VAAEQAAVQDLEDLLDLLRTDKPDARTGYVHLQ
jgi:hypothetical protein